MSLMARDDEPTEFEEGPGSKVLRCAPRWATIQTWAVSKRTVFFVALTSERQYDWLVNGLPARHDAFDTPIKLCTGSLCRRLNLCRALRSFEPKRQLLAMMKSTAPTRNLSHALTHKYSHKGRISWVSSFPAHFARIYSTPDRYTVRRNETAAFL
jgi:hypothetical protein